MSNLDKLVIYVDENAKEEDENFASGTMCGYVAKLNGALFLPKLHVPCIQQQVGRYVLVEAWGPPTGWNRLFSAVLCEVMVYA